MQRQRRVGLRRTQLRLGHPVLAVARGRDTDRVRRVLQQRNRQPLVLPALLRQQRAQDRQVDLAHVGRPEPLDQALPGHRLRCRRKPRRRQDGVLHQRRRDRSRHVEDLPLMRGIALDVSVVRFARKLVL
ncbi:hypothetical protein D9M72_439440 [compost metagenome]